MRIIDSFRFHANTRPLMEHLTDPTTRAGFIGTAVVDLVSRDTSILVPSNWQSRQRSGPDVL